MRVSDKPVLERESAAALDRVFTVGSRSSGGWLLLLMAGWGTAVVMGAACLGGVTVPALFLLGFGLALAGIGHALVFGRQNVFEVAVGPAGVTLRSVDGSVVTLPLGFFSEARHEVVTSQSSGSGTTTTTTTNHYVRLFKRDGGRIDLGQQGNEQRARRLAHDLSNALWAATEQVGAKVASAEDALEILQDTTLVHAHREGEVGDADYRSAPQDGALSVRWSLRPSHGMVVPGILTPLGVATGVLAISMKMAPVPGAIFAGLLAAFALFNLGRNLRDAGLSQLVRVGAKDLTIARLRGESEVERRVIPLEAITAVDFTHKTDVLGSTLALRMDGARNADAALAEVKPADLGSALAALRGAAEDRRRTVQVPLGRLKLGDRMRVDLAVSTEIARRTGRNPSEV